MRSICPRSFLLVIIQGINLVYSPQEPVAVASDLPAKSLDTQSVGTKQQLGLSHSCRMNTGRLCSLWSSVTFDSIRNSFCCWCIFVTGILIIWNAKKQNVGRGYASKPIQIHQTQVVDMKYTMHDTLHIQEQANDGLQQDVSGLFMLDI